jgi:hypothetical protein
MIPRPAALLALLLLPAAAAAEVPEVNVTIILPPTTVDLSTVTAPAVLRINAQRPVGGQPMVTDTSLSSAAVGSGYTAIPLPAFEYNRNEGAWYGALVPIFRANAKGQVEDIFCPLYLHNDLIGETFTMNYFGYRDGTKQYHAIVSKATRIERTVDLSYNDSEFGEGGRYLVNLQANSGKSAFDRFFGFGNLSPNAAESNYAKDDSNLRLSGGIKLPHSLQLIADERYQRVVIDNGAVTSLPQTISAFPNLPGVQGAQLWAQGLTLAYDTRDNTQTPLNGAYATIGGEYYEDFETNDRGQWGRVTAEARDYVPNLDGRAVFVPHFLADLIPDNPRGYGADSVPFYERPSLGGENTLRGFGRERYVSDFALVFNFEERFGVFERAIMGNVVGVEVTPFLDVGRVGRISSAEATFRDAQFNPGVGVRALARPNIAARVDVADGRDGPNVFVGLDYPF